MKRGSGFRDGTLFLLLFALLLIMIILKNPHWIKEKSVRRIALRLVYAGFKQIERGF